MSEPTELPPGMVRIVQGHPTGFDPSPNKGGQVGSPKPDGRSAADYLPWLRHDFEHFAHPAPEDSAG